MITILREIKASLNEQLGGFCYEDVANLIILFPNFSIHHSQENRNHSKVVALGAQWPEASTSVPVGNEVLSS